LVSHQSHGYHYSLTFLVGQAYLALWKVFANPNFFYNS
jgi:hypothetical protein